jgi:hypothetical protein
VGRLQQRSWTAEDGSAHSVVEVVAEKLGPNLRWATATTDQDDEELQLGAWLTASAGTSTPSRRRVCQSCPHLVLIAARSEAYTRACWARILDGYAPSLERSVMTALVNGLLWFGMFAIPMLIAVILRRRARKYGLADGTSGDPAQEPDTEGGHESRSTQQSPTTTTRTTRSQSPIARPPPETGELPAGISIAMGYSAVDHDARLVGRLQGWNVAMAGHAGSWRVRQIPVLIVLLVAAGLAGCTRDRVKASMSVSPQAALSTSRWR